MHFRRKKPDSQACRFVLYDVYSVQFVVYHFSDYIFIAREKMFTCTDDIAYCSYLFIRIID